MLKKILSGKLGASRGIVRQPKRHCPPVDRKSIGIHKHRDELYIHEKKKASQRGYTICQLYC